MKRYKRIKYPEGGEVPTQTASLYTRLVNKGIIDPNTMDENTFVNLPKEQVNGYFQQYKTAIGGLTQEEFDATGKQGTVISKTIFTGTEDKTTTDFNTAFANARASGQTTFEYNGQMYTTELGGANTGSATTTTQTNTDRMSNLVGNSFANGGNPQYDAITGALSPFIGMIPGGQFINMGLNLVGNLLPEKKVEEPYVGPYAMGGRVKYAGGGPTYEVEGNEVILGNSMLEGQSSASDFGSIAEGPTHANGGVSGMGGKYILSDRIGIDGSYGVKNPNSIASHARPIVKAFSKMSRRTFDVVDRNAEKIMTSKLDILKGINEAELKVREASEKFKNGGVPKYWAGGTGPGYDAHNTMADQYTGVEDAALNYFADPNSDYYKTTQGQADLAPYNVPVDQYTTYSDQSKVNLVDPNYYANAPKEMAPTNTNNAKVGGMDGLTAVGMGIAGLGSLGQILTTVNEHNQSLPNENFYEDISARAERTYNESLNTMNAQKIKSQRDINDAYGSVLFNQQGDSVNVDRAMKNVAYVNRSKNIADSNLAYDSAIADRKIGLSQLQMQGDTLNAQGKFQTRTADQQDLANYFTNLGANISDATGQALNAVKIAQNAKSQTQALSMLAQAYPNFTLSELQGMLQIIFKG